MVDEVVRAAVKRWPLIWGGYALLGLAIGAAWINPPLLRCAVVVVLVGLGIAFGEARAEKIEAIRKALAGRRALSGAGRG